MKFDIVATGTGDEMHRHGCKHSQRKGMEVVFTSDNPVALAEYCWDPTIMQEDADETNRSYDASCLGLLWDIVAPCAAEHL